MSKKQLVTIIVAILVVSVSLYSAFKPAPVIQSEQPVAIEDAQVLKSAEKFTAKVRQLAGKRSLRSFYRISSQDGEFFMNKSVKALKGFDRQGWKMVELTNTQKQPHLYVSKVTNEAGQRGSMLMKSPDGKRWAFIAFKMENQETNN